MYEMTPASPPTTSLMPGTSAAVR